MTAPEPGGRVLHGGELEAWLADPALEAYLRTAVAEMSRLPTGVSLRASQFWRVEERRVERVLGTIHAGGPGTEAPAGSADPLRRIVQWNILKGIALDEIVRVLEESESLRAPDALLLNEVDVGMARSGNRHIAGELAARLGMHWAFVPSYLELTKGPGAEAHVPGSNRLGLHGVAILTRARPLALRAVALPEAFDAFAFREKRCGRRTALFAALGQGRVVAGAHLEMRGTPQGRRAQIRALLEGLDAFGRDEARQGRVVREVILGGDFNTHTFARGTWRGAIAGGLRIALTPPGLLRRQLLEPWRHGREPLFAELRRAGFEWASCNDGRPTASETLDRIEEIDLLPVALRRPLRALLHRRLPLRLDWFAARGLPADRASARAATVGAWPPGTTPSDHLPIVLELAR
jgi:endonuclease/exonuclease/phosphatase family metal-dependent hydrolase